MDTFSMKCFLCVADRLNLSKAADIMGISQPAMSAQIKKMELELGVSLFTRDTHTVILTAAGQIVQERFRQILNDCAAMMQELEALKRWREQLHIGWHGPTNWAGIQDFLYTLMTENASIYPKSKSASSEELLKDVETGKLDVAFLEKSIVQGHKQLKWVELFQDSICFGVSMDHPLAKKQHLSLEELKDEKIYCKESDYAGIYGIMETLTLAGIKPENLFCMNQMDISAVTAMSQGGLVVFPRSFKLLGNRTVAYVDLDLPTRPIPYCLVWSRNNDNPLLPHFIQCCQRFPWPGNE